MKVAYVNPFVQGAQRVFNSLCQEAPALGRVFVKTAPYTTSPVTVSISIIGAFNGEVVYNMHEPTGCYIASKMMHGMQTSMADPMSQSAVAELANIISGNVATIFSGKGILIDISPPSFRLNATCTDFPMAANVPKVVCVPLHFQNGSVFEIDVLIPISL